MSEPTNHDGHDQPDRPDRPPRATQLLAEGVSDPVRAIAAALEQLQEQAVSGDLATGAVLTADVPSLSRLRHVLDCETARRVRVADAHDALHSRPTTVLCQAGWSAREARQTTAAGAFAETWPRIAELWARGVIGVDVVAALATATAPMTHEQVAELLDTLTPRLQHLTASDVRRLARHALELLRPDTGIDKEQTDYDRRFLAWTIHNGVTCLKGELPALEGAAFTAAITALAESLRAQGDNITKGQRNADALAALVARAAAKSQLPTAAGLPAAVSIVIGLNEADRVATGTPRTSHDTLAAAATACSGARQGAIGSSAATLGDAATRFLLCAADLTGILVAPAGTHTGTHTRCTTTPCSGTGGTSDQPDRRATPIATALDLTHLEILALGRTHRLANSAQRKAIAVRDVTCFIDGCTIPATECQPHHIPEWANGGRTDIDDLAPACWPHHRRLDLGRIAVTRNPDPTGPRWIGTPKPPSQWPRSR